MVAYPRDLRLGYRFGAGFTPVPIRKLNAALYLGLFCLLNTCFTSFSLASRKESATHGLFDMKWCKLSYSGPNNSL